VSVIAHRSDKDDVSKKRKEVDPDWGGESGVAIEITFIAGKGREDPPKQKMVGKRQDHVG